jgi:hypothetical protein
MYEPSAGGGETVGFTVAVGGTGVFVAGMLVAVGVGFAAVQAEMMKLTTSTQFISWRLGGWNCRMFMFYFSFRGISQRLALPR